MKESDYLNDEHVKRFLEYLEKQLPKFSHSYIFKKAPYKGQTWQVGSFLSAAWADNDREQPQGYWWPFKCHVMSGKEFVLHKGSNLKDSATALKKLSKLLEEALEQNDDVKAQMACQGVLAWGGVLKGNQQRLFGKARGLAKCLSDLKDCLNNSKLDDMDAAHKVSTTLWMNAGFTKIYSILAEDFCIYDGRVGAALGLLVRRYCEDGAKPLPKVPALLQFPWGEGVGVDQNGQDRRNPSRGNYVFPKLTNDKRGVKCHTVWNVRANWLIKEITVRLKVNPSKGLSPVRIVEAALFMIGYDVRSMLGTSGEQSGVQSLKCDNKMLSNLDQTQPKPVTQKSKSKKECAIEVYRRVRGKPRKEVVRLFEEECGLTKAGAQTYYQNISKSKVGD